jgi:glycosyltransferase A (GT-A) superfamily protein (DUF2064 family)
MTAADTTLVVIAKAPVPGRSKTRLTPPCTPQQAADLAEAALTDTLHAVLGTPAGRRVLVLEGTPGAWLPDGFEVLPQRGDGLDERLAAAFADVAARRPAAPDASRLGAAPSGGSAAASAPAPADATPGPLAPPALLVGMDTPQVTPELLAAAAAALHAPGVDAVLGHAPDGGYWAIGLRVQDPRLFVGVPMSTESTGRAQESRLREHGLSVALLPELRDVDLIDDARAVAALAPDSRFARALEATT